MLTTPFPSETQQKQMAESLDKALIQEKWSYHPTWTIAENKKKSSIRADDKK